MICHRSFEPLVLAQFQAFRGPKITKNSATFVPQTQEFFISKVGIFFHFGLSKPLKQPKTYQLLSKECSKSSGSNYLGPMPNHFF